MGPDCGKPGGGEDGSVSVKVLLQVLQVLHGRLVIQSEEESRAQTSVDLAAHALQALLSRRSQAAEVHPEPPPEVVTCSSASEQEAGEQVVPAWENCFPHVPDLERQIQHCRAHCLSRLDSSALMLPIRHSARWP